MFLSFVGVALLFLLLIWYFQIVHFERFYKSVKKRELKHAASDVMSQTENMADAIAAIADKYNVSINYLDSNGKSLYSAGVGKKSNIRIKEYEEYRQFYQKASDNGGNVMYQVNGMYRVKGTGNRPISTESETEKEKREYIPEAKCMIYAGIIEENNGENYLLLIASMVSPVEATVDTLRIQFIIISAVFLIMAVAISLVMSSVVSSPIVNINKSARHLAEGNFDITFEKKGYREVCELANTLNYATSEINKSKELQRDIVANISHDLRTPLTMIRAYAEGMRDLEGENTPENAQIIIDETIRLSDLVNDILNLSKLQSGVEQLECSEFDITENVLSVIERFSKYVQNDGYDINFSYKETVKVCADEAKIYQVIYNLIINAISHAGKDKKIMVRQLIQNGCVRIEVSDNGKGIDQSEINSIWDRYYKTQKEGSGIGLSIVKNILTMHKAKYGVVSKTGEGSTFWFELESLPNEK